MRLQGKVAIVTGAGGGIGAAICRHFAAEGAALIGVDVDAADVSARSRRPR
jgi:NAD(P)-dependent dehydrogenase (short-subunit alcohol dehydrogenase family)